MSTEKTPLFHKLILLVLVLILACLVILIAQQSSKSRVPADAELKTASPSEEIALPPMRERPRYLPITNRWPARPPRANIIPSANGPQDPSATAQGEELPQFTGTVPLDRAALLTTPPLGGALAGSTAGRVTGLASIHGRVWLAGTPPPEIPIPSGACGDLPSLQSKPITTRHYLVTPDGRLANVLVYIKDGLPPSGFAVPTNRASLALANCLYEPYVMGVQAGQVMTIRNSDPLTHSLHSTSKLNRQVNFALSTGQTRNLIFAKPEIFPLVRMSCDLHPWEFAYIGVLPHPFFAVTDGEGMFSFRAGLPPGKYLIAAFHVKAGESVQEISVGENDAKFLEFSLSVPLAN